MFISYYFLALIEVCDEWDACRVAESSSFVVRHASDSHIASEHAMDIIQSRIVDGDVFKALELLESVRRERCNSTINPQLVDTLLSKLLAEGILSSTQFVFNLLNKYF